MDTNICLYCEIPLEEDSEFIGFCSTQCHDKEQLKTKVPTWAVLHSIHGRMRRLPFILAPRPHNLDTLVPPPITPICTSTLLTSYEHSTSTASPMHLYLHTFTTKL
ncbi:hypothetical protein [Absidia glauca]|uniref:Uncharacterized protein n=1 Tax=Absidia glauca TaxID=4829 RepID=A0A163J8B5_ABSGL|nr:hypothetical protein [Absidia glauca]